MDRLHARWIIYGLTALAVLLAALVALLQAA
jgi:hypothetical protein